MKLRLIKILNKILAFINKIFNPKVKHTKEELEEEIEKLMKIYEGDDKD